MLKRFGPPSNSMLHALGLWPCSLPLALIMVAPLLGWQAAGIVALLLLFAALIMCGDVCSLKIFQDRSHQS